MFLFTVNLKRVRTIFFGLEDREYSRGDRFHWAHNTLYPQKLALTSPTSDGRSVGIVRSRAKATEFILLRTIFLKYERVEIKSLYVSMKLPVLDDVS
jgi:hypothetical protein